MRVRLTFVLLLALCSAASYGQDVLTVGTGSGLVVTVPVYLRDVSGTPLGSDARAGNRIQGIGFRISYPVGQISAISFSRAGVLQSLTPMYESSAPSTGAFAYVVSFSETSSPIPFTLNAAPPGDLIGNLTITVSVGNPAVALTIDTATATLSNQAGTVLETVASGALSLVHGSVSILSAPTGLNALAAGATQVDLTWNAVAGASQYEVHRSTAIAAPFTFVSNAAGTSYSDPTAASGTTYLYRVRAVSAANDLSPLSTLDAATTVMFTDEPLVAGVTVVKALHFTELRTAVNAMRTAAGQATSTDPTIATGLPIMVTHIQNLRADLAAARAAIGLPALSLTDAVITPGVSIKAAHLQELRAGVK